MDNNVLQVIKNENFDNINLKMNNDHLKKKKYLIRFTVFITIALLLFGGIFFIKGSFEDIRNYEENLKFQKQKLVEQRSLMEKKFREENENILKLKIEYEEKNRQLNETLNSLKFKEETLNSEILKARELGDLFKKQIVDMYGINIDRQYKNDVVVEDGELNNSDNNLIDDEGNAIHTNMVGEKDQKNITGNGDRLLGIANADWFIKFNSLGEFNY